jgi:hypothetical protein
MTTKTKTTEGKDLVETLGSNEDTTSNDPATPEMLFGLIVISADALSDLESTRIAAENRARALRQTKGLPELAERQDELVDALKDLEHQASLELKRLVRKHPIGAWVKETPGLGEQQIGRLLASIGDPAARPNVAKLWAYCGLHVVDGKRPRLKKGVQANWSTQAKTRAWLCATSTIKFTGEDGRARSPYRNVYDHERNKWLDRDTTDLHKHNHAMSVTAKEILKDLWQASRIGAGLPYRKNQPSKAKV